MDKIRIKGGTPLVGDIPISGAKNAALPILAATLLMEDPLTLYNLPDLADIASMTALLEQMGTVITEKPLDSGGKAASVLRTKTITSTKASYEIVRKMRASILVLGPLLARAGHAEVSLPGGCAIGTRPVDLHLHGLEKLGAVIELHEGYIEARTPNGLKGAEVIFPKISVGATENLMMAACLAQGQTRLINAAMEPEIVDLAICLKSMGADISGEGTEIITIQGKSSLHAAEHSILPDRIEAATYAMAAAITGGELRLLGARQQDISSVVDVLDKAGVGIRTQGEGLLVSRKDGKLYGVDAMTAAFPGFPTDVQAQFMALMAVCEGASMITETIFENRFMHVPELLRMGANITVHNNASALVRGQPKLIGAPVMATDLRASVCLVLAALCAEGTSEISRVYHLDRGYDNLEEKLSACGADIERVREKSNL